MFLRLSDLPNAAGRGVRVAVIDSGVHVAHPHVQGVLGGIGINRDGSEHSDYIDRLGHGTAVAAVIREKAPDASVFVIKVFDRELSTTADALVAAIDVAVRDRARLINLSLGTSNPDHEHALTQAIARAGDGGAEIVAAAPQAGIRWLPGALAGVIAVELDWAMPRDQCRIEREGERIVRAYASGFPRPIPGVDPERNLKGVSFAVANVTGLLARGLTAT
jgi:hypothetical protein